MKALDIIHKKIARLMPFPAALCGEKEWSTVEDKWAAVTCKKCLKKRKK